MSSRSNQRIQFAFTAALALHALAAFGIIEHSRTRSGSENVVVSVMNMNWEVAAAIPTAVHESVKKGSGKKIIAGDQIAAPTQATSPSAQVTSPNPAVMENYLAAIRDRLGSAIHLHQPRGAVGSELILKVAIYSSGSVGQTEIEKTSQHPEIDRAVIAAFESLLPLSPFPDEWKKAVGSPEMITVRIPVVIKPRN